MKPKTVTVQQCSAIAMTTGGEKTHSVIVDGMWVKRWIGFGWINDHYATRRDREKYPTVTRRKS